MKLSREHMTARFFRRWLKVEYPCLPSHAQPCPTLAPTLAPPMLPPPAAMSPGASRTLSNLEQMESPGTIPAVPAAAGAAAGAAAAAGLSAQRAEAVEALKSAAVQRRLPVVPVPLGAAGACWTRCQLCLGKQLMAHTRCKACRQLPLRGRQQTLCLASDGHDYHLLPTAARPHSMQARLWPSPCPPGCCASHSSAGRAPGSPGRLSPRQTRCSAPLWMQQTAAACGARWVWSCPQKAWLVGMHQ